jgi:AraC-like DNA-binding protein
MNPRTPQLKFRSIDKNTWLQSINSRTQIKIPLCGHRILHTPWEAKRPGRPETLIYFIETGSISGFIEEKSIRVGSGSILWISPQVPHQLHTETLPWTLFNLRVRIYQARVELKLNQPFLLVQDAWSLRPLMQQLFDEMSSPSSYHDSRIRWILSLLSSGIFDLLSRPEAELRTLTSAQRVIVNQHIQTHATGRIDSSDLAAQLKLSRNYFSELFRNTYGVAPRKWIKQERIRVAAQHLIDSTLNISEIAEEFGYDDIYLFSRQFKQVMGCSPKAYREKH